MCPSAGPACPLPFPCRPCSPFFLPLVDTTMQLHVRLRHAPRGLRHGGAPLAGGVWAPPESGVGEPAQGPGARRPRPAHHQRIHAVSLDTQSFCMQCMQTWSTSARPEVVCTQLTGCVCAHDVVVWCTRCSSEDRELTPRGLLWPLVGVQWSGHQPPRGDAQCLQGRAALPLSRQRSVSHPAHSIEANKHAHIHAQDS